MVRPVVVGAIAFLGFGAVTQAAKIRKLERSPNYSACSWPVFGNHPSWTPDGTKILYAKTDGSFQTVRPRDGSSQRLTPTGQNFGKDPVLSPDGAKIAYVDPQGNVAIIRLQPLDLTPTVIAPGDDPAWSPDGKRLAIGDKPGSSGSGVTVVDIDGSNAHTVATNAVYHDADPTWSPNGALIAFNGYTRSNELAIQLVHPDGTGLHSLDPKSDQGFSTDQVGVDPSWSPDGRSIVYTHVLPAYLPAEIHIVRSDGGGDHRLTHNVFVPNTNSTGRDDYSPLWAPKGKQILFLAGPSNNTSWVGRDVGRLWLIDSNGRGKHPVAPRCVFGTGERDVLGGVAGRGHIFALEGNDLVLAQDHRRETVNCGAGRDTAIVDGIDSINRNCETVRRR